jgi:hypothetical protein
MSSSLERLAFASVILLLGLSGQGLAGEMLQRVSGTVTYDNYPGLEAFLLESIDLDVGLNVSFVANSTDTHGTVSAGDGNAQFTAYRHGGQDHARIVAEDGYVLKNGSYVLDGFYHVADGGLNAGIPTILLSVTQPPDGATIDDVAIDSLQYEISD